MLAAYKPGSMNFANMIEEKRLKKSFIIATLMSTIMGTFSTGINLIEQRQEKREERDKQDKKKKGKKGKKGKDEEEEDDFTKDEKSADVKKSLARGAPALQKELEKNFAGLGPQYDQGDAVGQEQRQDQVINLQNQVINILETALLTGKLDDVNKLYDLSENARIRALQDQSQRLPQKPLVDRPLPSAHPGGKGAASKEIKSPTRKKPVSDFDASGPLYCKYADTLQISDGKLHSNFSPGKSCKCPVCDTHIPIQVGRTWRIDKELVHEPKFGRQQEKFAEQRTFYITNRFFVKCHREKAGFACYLCSEHRQSDTLYETLPRFVNHVWKKHNIREYEEDPDIESKESFEKAETDS